MSIKYRVISSKRGLLAGVKSIGYWNIEAQNEDEKGAQIDLLIEYDNNVYDIIECKYYNDEFVINKEYALNMINKINMFIKYGLRKKKYSIHTGMITTYGTKVNQYSQRVGITQNISLLDLLGE